MTLIERLLDACAHRELALRQRLVNRLLRGVHVQGLSFGKRSITLSPAGVGDVVRWSAAQAPVALGDIGMDVATGLAQVFHNGAAKGLLPARLVTSGSSTIAAATTATMSAGLVRSTNEVLTAWGFVTDNVAGAAFAHDRIVIAATDDFGYWFERTVTANTYDLLGRNNLAAGNRTLDWAVLGLVP